MFHFKTVSENTRRVYFFMKNRPVHKPGFEFQTGFQLSFKKRCYWYMLLLLEKLFFKVGRWLPKAKGRFPIAVETQIR